MFGRSSKKRKELEGDNNEVDYRAKLLVMFNDMDRYFPNKHHRRIAEDYKTFVLQISAIATPEDYKKIYQGIISGDPKRRTFRSLYQRVYGRYIDKAKKEMC